MSDSLTTQLASGLAQWSMDLSPTVQAQLVAYVHLLHKWNHTYNLTAIREPQEMLVKHVLDALSVLPYLPSQGHWIDIGSGGGIPGLILAIADERRRWTLLDSNGKKTRFLTQAILSLGLSARVQVVHARAEQHHHRYDGIISRAVTDIHDLIALTQHLRAETASWWLMKGVYPQDEIAALPSATIGIEAHALQVPYLDADRWLMRCYPL